MNVDKYTYKTEFQDRGAGHVHGTLWIRIKKMESLLRLPDGSLLTPDEYKKSGSTEKTEKPFEQLTNAFRKFKNDTFEKEDLFEEQAVVNFIDEFTTVSLNREEVGQVVARIAEEVNKHGHTKTCRKGREEEICRFGYPKFPIWTTVLVRPYKTEFSEEKQSEMKKYAEVLMKVRLVMEDKEAVDNIMNQYDKAKESKELYQVNRGKKN